jgi:phosphotransferase system enzyme I (PtsI)
MPIERLQGEKFFQGVGVSPGIAIGPVYLAEKGMTRIPEYHIPRQEVPAERERFDAAVQQSQKQLRTLQGKATALSGAAGEEFGYLLEAHIQMLTGSRLVRSVGGIIESELLNAEAAIQVSLNQIAEDFEQIDDPYLAARMEDIREVGARLVRNLIKVPFAGFEHVATGSIIVGEDISPADVALMDPARIAGFSAALGGAEGHTAIMARSLGLPAVLGLPNIVQYSRSGDVAIIDGNSGQVILNPSLETIASYRDRQRRHGEELQALAGLRDVLAVTRDGLEISLEANIELPAEIGAALNSGAMGVGLLRSEFMFMNRETLPGEEEQFHILKTIVQGMKGAPVTIRTLDVGGDKLAYSLGAHLGVSNNPALGLRAIRLSLKVPVLFEDQICAILRAAAYGPVRILLPMITTVSEVLEVRGIIGEMEKRLKRRGEEMAATTPPVGIMIEIPAAALSADSLARVSDFFSIGTNDLTMYTLAIDRGNEQVAHLYDSLNPAVLRLLQFSAEAARRAGIPVNLCGEMAGDEKFTAFLIGLGLKNLSMAPTALPRIKRRIRQLHGADARRLADHVMGQYDRREIAASLDNFNKDLELS